MLTLALLYWLTGGEEPPRPPKLAERLTVTASGSPQALIDAAVYVSTLSRAELETPGRAALDERLRRLPAFSLLRPSGSLYAHPTTQGFSLRSVAASGASRALALFDGLPLNDPFGGWVYWNRIPTAAVERVELARGAASQLYGGSALSGALQLLPRPLGEPLNEARLQIGERGAGDAELFHRGGAGGWRWLASGRALDSGGHFLVEPSQRGAVDRPAGVAFQNLFARAQRGGFHAGVNIYDESRDNGTAVQRNRTRLELVELGLTRAQWSWRLHGQRGVFENAFSRVFPGRDDEVQVADQRFESYGAGTSLTYRPNEPWRFGADWRYAEWNGRDQNLAGLFAQRSAPLGKLELLAGARLDFWRGDRARAELNPRLGLVYRATDSTAWRASAYRGFRPPTLNELHRPFRVGDVFTEANPELDAESLWGAELGVDHYPAPGFMARGALFFNRLNDPIGNATVASGPEGILRRRANLGPVDVWGVELEAEWETSRFDLRAAAQWSESRVKATDLRLPLAPRGRASLGLSWRGPVTARLEGRYEGRQFDDDRNELALGGFALADLSLSKRFNGSWEVYAGVENLLDRRYAFSLTPEPRYGSPRTVYAGARWRGAPR